MIEHWESIKQRAESGVGFVRQEEIRQLVHEIEWLEDIIECFLRSADSQQSLLDATIRSTRKRLFVENEP